MNRRIQSPIAMIAIPIMPPIKKAAIFEIFLFAEMIALIKTMPKKAMSIRGVMEIIKKRNSPSIEVGPLVVSFIPIDSNRTESKLINKAGTTPAFTPWNKLVLNCWKEMLVFIIVFDKSDWHAHPTRIYCTIFIHLLNDGGMRAVPVENFGLETNC